MRVMSKGHPDYTSQLWEVRRSLLELAGWRVHKTGQSTERWIEPEARIMSGWPLEVAWAKYRGRILATENA